MMETFYNTLKTEENKCPPGCSACQEKCIESGWETRTSRSCINIVRPPGAEANSVVICNQCAVPACAEVCPTGAITKSKSDGVVRINLKKCAGCGLCSLACAYGAIHYEAGGKAIKCDLCGGSPQCVDVCPYNVISFIKSRSVLQYLHDDPFMRSSSRCAGCLADLSLRFTMRVIGKDSFLLGAPGCTPALIMGWGTQACSILPSHMTNMTNLPSTAAGIKRYYKKLGRDVKCICFAGDGCLVDVGFQPLSGAAERGENIIVICCDNEGYMNTGIQRSGTTPYLGWTFTSPVGKRRGGKETPPKPMPLIMSAHQIPYVATATIGYPEDYARKLIKAMAVKDGLAYIHLFTPCATGWRFRPDLGIDVCRAAVETNYFPLWEYERGQYRITRVVDKPKPITEYTKLMGKFAHLDKKGIEELQQLVNNNLDLIRALDRLVAQK